MCKIKVFTMNLLVFYLQFSLYLFFVNYFNLGEIPQVCTYTNAGNDKNNIVTCNNEIHSNDCELMFYSFYNIFLHFLLQ